jgi:DNA sulfur modification protein DndD
MHFVSLRMHNWRQYLGSQEPILFSTDPDKPITLLLGPNGSGKTGLLNAFTWCLYEDFTAGFGQPDSLIHDLAVAQGGDPYVEVQLTLDDDGDEFTVIRRRRLADDHSTVRVMRRPGPGRARAGETLEASVNDVYNFLPRSLKDVFFFPAESLQTLSITDGVVGGGIDLRKAVESLLGFDTYTRASSNLNAAVQASMLRTPQQLRDQTIEAAKTKWEDAKQQLELQRQRRAQLPDLIAQAKDELDRATEIEREHDEAAIEAWVKERDRLREDRDAAKTALEAAQARINGFVRETHHALYADGFVEDAIRALNTAERGGKIPPSVSSDILDRLLEEPDLPCVVCGRPMDDETHEYVGFLRDQVTDSNVAANAMNIRGQLRTWQRTLRQQATEAAIAMDADVDALPQVLGGLVSRLTDAADDNVISARAALTEAEAALAEFESADRDVPDADASQRAVAHLRGCERNHNELVRELEGMQGLLDEAAASENAAKLDYERKAAKQQEYHQKQVVQTLLSDTAEVFDRIAQEMKRYGQQDFQRALNQLYRQMINKPYKLEVAENFMVRVLVNDKDRAPSQSEKTALTIAFLGAVAGLAPQYRSILSREGLGDMGKVRLGKDAFPVVLDAPYSPFDETYAGTITNAIGDLATQLVLTTSKDSLRHISKIGDRVGRAYVLHVRTNSKNLARDDVQSKFENEVVEWRGKSRPYVTIDESVGDVTTSIEAC